MMSEVVNTSERDMSRAEWQRGIGAIVFARAVDQILSAEPELPAMQDIEAAVEKREAQTGIPIFWLRAHRTLSTILTERIEQQEDELLPRSAEQGIKLHTHFGRHGDPRDTLYEGFNAQIHFPLNIAQIIAMTARRWQIPGYELRTYKDLSAFLVRPDFIAMMNQALVASNGAWQRLSSEEGVETHTFDRSEPVDGMSGNVLDDLVFSDNTVAFGSLTLARLRERMRYVNQKGSSTHPAVLERTSSGCPARHQKPSFAYTTADWQALHALAGDYGVPVHDLLVARERNPVEDGLHFMATVLSKLDDQLAD
jgi:hypothetical protein